MMNDDIKQKLINTLQKFNTEEYGFLQPEDILKPNTLIIDNIISKDLFDSYYINDKNIMYYNEINNITLSTDINNIYCISSNQYLIDTGCFIDVYNNQIINYANQNTTYINNIISQYNISCILQEAFYESHLNLISSNIIKCIQYKAFNNSQLVSAIIPYINRIEDFAFENCNNLLTVNIKNVSYLGNGVFENCSHIQNIDLLPNLKHLGSSVFKNCISLSNINLENTNISALYEFTFDSCKSLTSLILPKTLNEMTNCVFDNCINLKYIYFKDFTHIVNTRITNSFLPNDFKIIVPDYLYDNWKNNESSFYAKTVLIKESDYFNH